MVISIRRSQHEEGEELVAIWCRSVDATHDFLSAEYRAELEELVRSFLPEAPLWVAVNERDQPVGFMLLSGHQIKQKAQSEDWAFLRWCRKRSDATLARLLQPGQARQGRLIPPHTPDSATDTVSPNRPPQSVP